MDDVLDSRSFSLDEREVFDESNPRESDEAAATSRLSDIAGDVTHLSRAGGFANYAEACAPAANTEMSDGQRAEYHLNSNFDYTTYLDPDAVMPTTGADNGLTLADLRDADYDDPRWDQLLDQMSVDEMVNLISMFGYQTPAVESVGKVQTIDADGPTAINQNFTGEGSIGLPIPVVIASTWSPDLQYEYGEIMGQMCREMGVEGWYAPGVNIHRSAFGARNYEFYSEDGTLSGLIAARAVEGAKSKGVYAYVKYFALYDGNAKMVCVWADEQAAREIYLRAFEIPVKEAGAKAVMVSWNFLGTKWSGESSELMNDILRGEWGFRGMALTDFFRNNGHGFMNADAALANGVDAMLSTYGGGPNVPADVTDASTVQYMRHASKNIMYTVVSSWAYEDDAADVGLAGWQMVAIGVAVVLAAVLVGCEVLTVRGYRRRLSA
ncbi:glycoside hydrolase family 3 N-terminal domain-containing protein [Olsenella profusa]|nr:glycoside hydrolase family 3 N-terminal domain-containing protein [Olsenella profusa]